MITPSQRRYTVIASDHPSAGRMADSNEFTGPMTRQFFDDLAAAEKFYQQQVDWLDVGCVQFWDEEQKIRQECW